MSSAIIPGKVSKFSFTKILRCKFAVCQVARLYRVNVTSRRMVKIGVPGLRWSNGIEFNPMRRVSKIPPKSCAQKFRISWVAGSSFYALFSCRCRLFGVPKLGNQIWGVIALVSLSGCASEVDKCVAEWEKANPGPDNGGDYCRSYERDDRTGRCSREASQTKAQVRAEIRRDCLRASNGSD